MRTERNEFQQLVDHQLANVQWDHRMSGAVLRKLRQQEPVRRTPALRIALACAGVVLCLALVALSILNNPPAPDVVVATQPVHTTLAPVHVPDTRAEAVFQARQAVMEKYGLTLRTLGVFLDDCQLTDTGWVVTFETSGQINHRLAGVYTVEKQNGSITAAWSHDDVDPALWADGTLNRVAWGQEQLLYALGEGSRDAFTINQEINAIDGFTINYDYIEGTELWGDPLANDEPQEGDIPVEEAIAAAREAIRQQFGLDPDQVYNTEGEPILTAAYAQMRQSASGVRVWLFTPAMDLPDDEYYVAICINARTGELERLEYTTLGNG